MEGPPLPIPPLRIPFDELPRRLRGYDRRLTEQLVEGLALSYAALWRECEVLRGRVAEVEAEHVRRQAEAERLLGEAFIEAQRAAGVLRDEARQDAEAAVKTARRKARSIVGDADREARIRSGEILSESQRERNRLEAEIRHARAFVDETHEDLSRFLVAAVQWYRRSLENGAPGLAAGEWLDEETLELLAAEEVPAQG